MSKPSFVSDEEIAELDKKISLDINGTMLDMESFIQNSAYRDVMRAGLWMTQELLKQGCNEVLVVQFQYTFGKESFGFDPWEKAQELLNAYMNNTYTIAEN